MGTLRDTIVDAIENVITRSWSWLATEREALGMILHTIHMLFAYSLILLLIVSHTIYPVLWFQMVVFVLWSILWLQHIVLRVCVLASAESRFLVERKDVLIATICSWFGISEDPANCTGVMILSTSIIMGCLTLETLARLSMLFREYMGWHLWG